MRWVTRSAPHVDRMACAWLIRRCIDPDAQFCFVADPADVPADATPFDMRGAELSHHGEDCTFETMLKRYDLKDPVLHELALLVHEADLADDRFYAPAALGLDLVTRGISLVCDNDEALTVGMRIFDGLYELTRQQLLRGPPRHEPRPGRGPVDLSGAGGDGLHQPGVLPVRVTTRRRLRRSGRQPRPRCVRSRRPREAVEPPA